MLWGKSDDTVTIQRPIHRFDSSSGVGKPVAVMPPYFLLASVTLFIVFGMGLNMLLAMGALAALLLGGRLLWRAGEAPILLFVFLYQWLQATIAIFYANAQGLPLTDVLRQYSTSADVATALSIGGLLALALGMRIGAGRRVSYVSARIREIVALQPIMGWFKLYAATWVLCTAAQSLAYAVPALSQIMLTLAQLKWAAFLVFTVVTFTQGRGRKLWFLIFAAEFILSIGGFFSSFKDVFLFALIGLGATDARPTGRQIATASILSLVLLLLAVVWTAIKGEYRSYVSHGEMNQTVSVSVSAGDQWQKLADLIVKLDARQMTEAAEVLVRRMSYVEFFGAVLETVPAVVPHQQGALWLDAVSRPFMPRLFFPNKAALDDSEVTRRYTGASIAGSDEGTSISIGYMGESYVDFGMIGMMAPIFGLGLLLGRAHRWLTLNRSVGPLFGAGLATTVLISTSRLETTAAKTFGGLAISMVVTWVLIAGLIPRYLRHLQRRSG